MKLILAVFSVGSFFLMSVTSAQASELNLTRFRIAPIEVLQGDSDTTSIMVNWTPSFRLDDWEHLRVGASFGFSSFMDRTRNHFPVSEYAATGEYLFEKENRGWAAELQFGVQLWHRSDFTSACMAGAGVSYYPDTKILGWIDRFSAMYTPVFTDQFSNEFRLGFGIAF